MRTLHPSERPTRLEVIDDAIEAVRDARTARDRALALRAALRLINATIREIGSRVHALTHAVEVEQGDA